MPLDTVDALLFWINKVGHFFFYQSDTYCYCRFVYLFAMTLNGMGHCRGQIRPYRQYQKWRIFTRIYAMALAFALWFIFTDQLNFFLKVSLLPFIPFPFFYISQAMSNIRKNFMGTRILFHKNCSSGKNDISFYRAFLFWSSKLRAFQPIKPSTPFDPILYRY